jgi:hypothetical protein
MKTPKSRYKNLAGKKFGRWTVLEIAYISNGVVFWKCRCDCGKESIVRAGSLPTGRSKSCGCYKNEVAANLKRTHGWSGERLFAIWKQMKRRCCDQKAKDFSRYGARGIIVCNEWANNYEAFKEWAFQNGYGESLSIDRIDNNKGYFPENCRWETPKGQSRNLRSNHLFTFNGKTQCIAAWAEEFGIRYGLVGLRISRGWPVEQALGLQPRSMEV